MTDHTRIVVYILVTRGSQILMGKRKGAFGQGEWCMPAGHLEFNESFEGCAARELLEETGLTASQFNLVALRNQHPYTSAVNGPTERHYVILGFQATDWAGTPTLTEPDRCEGWEWVELERLPEPLFEPARMVLECYRTGQVYITSAM